MSNDLYNSKESRYNTVLGERKAFFTLLRRLKEEYDQAPRTADYSNWVLEQYGIQLKLDRQGNITGKYTIVDEQKYLICRIKYPD